MRSLRLKIDPIRQVNPNNPPWPAYRGYHEYSFAHATMQSRLPTILGKAIEDATRTLNTQSSEERVVDLVQAIERMGDLMTDLSGNAKLRPIIDDDEADVALWNKEIAKYFQGDFSCRLVIGYIMTSYTPKARIS